MRKVTSAPQWAEAVAAFTAFAKARTTQDARGMVASLARLEAVVTAADAHAPAGALSPKHQRFVSEYLIDLNASAAYARCGYVSKSPQVEASRLLTIPNIQAAIADGKARQMATAELSAARVLEELRRLAFANVRDYFDPITRDAKHPCDLTAEQGAALAGFEVLIKNAKAGDGVTDTIHKFKLWDKVHSLEILAKHFALLVEKIELKSVTADARVARLVAARKRMTEK